MPLVCNLSFIFFLYYRNTLHQNPKVVLECIKNQQYLNIIKKGKKNRVRIEKKLEHLFIQMKEYQIWAGKLPQLVVKPDDLCLTPRIHIVVGKN